MQHGKEGSLTVFNFSIGFFANEGPQDKRQINKSEPTNRLHHQMSRNNILLPGSGDSSVCVCACRKERLHHAQMISN